MLKTQSREPHDIWVIFEKDTRCSERKYIASKRQEGPIRGAWNMEREGRTRGDGPGANLRAVGGQ